MSREAMIALRDRMVAHIRGLQAEVRGIERAIAVIDGADPDDVAAVVQPTEGRAPRGSVKRVILDMLARRGAYGLDATTAIALAQADGVTLERQTVSSLLSRLKGDGVVRYDGKAYRLTTLPAPPAPTGGRDADR